VACPAICTRDETSTSILRPRLGCGNGTTDNPGGLCDRRTKPEWGLGRTLANKDRDATAGYSTVTSESPRSQLFHTVINIHMGRPMSRLSAYCISPAGPNENGRKANPPKTKSVTYSSAFPISPSLRLSRVSRPPHSSHGSKDQRRHQPRCALYPLPPHSLHAHPVMYALMPGPGAPSRG
jgi:hypothetical protein